MEKYITFVKAHEKLIIICLGVWLAFHFYGDVLNVWTEHDKRQVAVQQQIATTAQQKVQADSQATTQLIQQLADLKLQYASLSSQIQTGIVKRAQDTNAQKQKDNQASPTELAVRTSEILHVQPQEINSLPDGSVSFSVDATHKNINALEDGAQAEANVIDLNKQIAVDTSVIGKQDETITGLNTELSDEKTSHLQDVKLEKANTKLAVDEGKKQFRKGLKWGAIVGFIGGLFAGHYI